MSKRENVIWSVLVLGIVFSLWMGAQSPTINPATQVRGPQASFAVVTTPTSVTLFPGAVNSPTAGLFGVNGGTLNWAGAQCATAASSGCDGGELWVGPGTSGSLPDCFYSVGIQPGDLSAPTFAGGGCAPGPPLPGQWAQQVIVANGVIQPLAAQYIPVQGP